MADRLKPYLNPGADVSRLDPAFIAALTNLFGAAPPEIAGKLRIGSGYRDEQTQARLFADAVKKYGSPDAARKWVAPPGKSRHNHGAAVDLSFGDDAVKQWVHANAKAHGLHFPMSWEPWHVEPVGGRAAPAAAGAPHTVPTAAAPSPVPGAQSAPPNLQALLASFAPQPGGAQQAFYSDPRDDALTHFGTEVLGRREAEEAEKRARRRALFMA